MWVRAIRGRPAEQDRLVRRVARFAEVDEGFFVWTRDTNGWFWLGRVSGPYFDDADETATAVDLVHVRPCESRPCQCWNRMRRPLSLQHSVGGGRYFQEIHYPSTDKETQRIWDARNTSARRGLAHLGFASRKAVYGFPLWRCVVAP